MGLGKPSPDTSNYYDGLWDKSPGIASVGSYQASGHPYVSGTIVGGLAGGASLSFPFPNVSKSITLLPLNDVADFAHLHFAPASAGPSVATDHGIPFPAFGNPAVTIDVKCKEVFVTNVTGAPMNQGFTFYASLTGIATSQMFALTGSGVTE